MKAILVGYGEIGRGVYEVFGEYHQIDKYDPITAPDKPVGKYDILVLALPYFDGFIDVVKGYQEEYGVSSTISFGTTPVGTCSKIGAVHCPVEGRHPNLAESIRITDKWLGGNDDLAERFLKEAKFNVLQLDRPEYTEFLKLRSTTAYGVNIEFARYSKKICDELGLDYARVNEWDRWVNGIYDYFNMTQFTRPILEPPVGAKGGHCVTPNAKILNKQYPNEMVRIVAEEV